MRTLNNLFLDELADRYGAEALGERSATGFCGDGKDAKSLNGRRGVRPVGEGSSRLTSMAR